LVPAFLILSDFCAAKASADEKTGSPSVSSPEDALDKAVSDALLTYIISRDTKNTLLVRTVIVVHSPTNMAFEVSFRSGNDVWPLGPIAWRRGEYNFWEYDVDMPESIKQVDVYYTPSRKAATELGVCDPKSIWMGAPIIRRSVPIEDEGISICTSDHINLLEEVDESDPTIQQLERDGDHGKAFTQLQQEVAAHPQDARALYNLGCLTVTNGDLKGASKICVEVLALQPPVFMQRKVQHLQLMICQMNLSRVGKGDAAAMCAMGDAYENGYGVKQLPDLAKRWYRDASNAGDADAMCHLAAMYEHEFGATVRTDDAHAWYRRESLALYRTAAELGNLEAKEWLASHDQQ
jgi:hypothetical protein